MIIESLFNAIIKIFTSAFSFVNIPQIPSDLLSSVNSTIDTIITNGSKMINLFIPYNVAKILLTVVIAIELAIIIYKFVMWIIKKIPMAGMS